MGFYLTPRLDYYEGDRVALEDIDVPQRPDQYSVWNGTGWEQGVKPAEVDPITKLRIFLAANPDVVAIL